MTSKEPSLPMNQEKKSTSSDSFEDVEVPDEEKGRKQTTSNEAIELQQTGTTESVNDAQDRFSQTTIFSSKQQENEEQSTELDQFDDLSNLMPELENQEQPTQSASITQQENQTSDFYYKQCYRIKKENDKKCKCGGLIKNHADSAIEGADDEEWNSDRDTKKVPSTSRYILFRLNEVVGSQAQEARYMRISDDADVGKVVDIHRQNWKRDYYPEISLSFIGGCDQDFISQQIEDELKSGISTVLHAMNCILITRASHIGLAKLIGSICKRESKSWNYGYSTKCVGVMPWGCILDRESLERLSVSKDGRSYCRYTAFKTNHKDEVPLDPNHHEFLLVDDGSLHRFGTEIKFLSRLQQSFFSDMIPSVSILVGGGLSTLKTIDCLLFPEDDVKNTDSTNRLSFQAIRSAKRYPVPIVIMKNTGRLANVLSDVLQSPTVNETETKDKISAAVKTHLNVDEDTVKEFERLLFKCISKKDLLFLHEIRSSTEEKHKEMKDMKTVIAYAALQGLEKTEANFSGNLLHLALESNEMNVVRRLLDKMKPTKVYKLLLDCMQKRNMFRMKELIERYEVDVHGFVEKFLHELYKTDNPMPNADRSPAQKISEFFQKRYPKEIKVFGATVKLFDIDSALEYLSNEETSRETHTFQEAKVAYNPEVINAMQAILINRSLFLQLSDVKFLWRYDHYNPLSNALLVHTLLSGLVNSNRKTKLFPFIPDELNETIEHFEVKMVSLLDEYYKTDRDMAKKALSWKMPLWRDRSFVDVAGSLGLKSVIEKTACQLVLKEAWQGQDRDCQRKLRRLKSDATEACCFSSIFRWLWYLLNLKLGVPIIKFYLHVAMYTLSVFAFSFYSLFTKSPAHEPIKWIMLVMVVALTLDEIRQVADVEKKLKRNIREWGSSFWNKLDVFSFVLFYIGIALDLSNQVFPSKIIFAFFLFFSWIKMTQFLRRSSFLGPYMVMILKMLSRMKTFMIIASISVLAYGVFMTAMLFPNARFDWNILFKVFFRPYLLLFAELGLQNHELSNDTTVFGTEKVHLVSELMVILGMSVFLLFANILLINLLIAEFSYVYDDIQKRSNQIWRYEQYTLLAEFRKKPVLPVPFSVFENVCLLYKYCKKRKTRTEVLVVDGPINVDAEVKRREVAEFARFCMKELPDLPS